MPPRLAHQALQSLTYPSPPDVGMRVDQPELSCPIGDQGPAQSPATDTTLKTPHGLPEPPLILQPLPSHTTSVATGNDIGGGGMHPADISTKTEVIYSLHGYTLVISRADMDLHGLELGAPSSRQRALDLLPIRFGCRYTSKQWWATPGDGFCGLHSLLRLKSGLAPSAKQRPNLPALITLITDVLPTLSVTEN